MPDDVERGETRERVGEPDAAIGGRREETRQKVRAEKGEIDHDAVLVGVGKFLFSRAEEFGRSEGGGIGGIDQRHREVVEMLCSSRVHKSFPATEIHLRKARNYGAHVEVGSVNKAVHGCEVMEIGAAQPAWVGGRRGSRRHFALLAGETGNSSREAVDVSSWFSGDVANHPFTAAIPEGVRQKSAGSG